MPPALQVVTGTATIAAGPVFTAAAAVTGDTFVVPTFDLSQKSKIARAWGTFPHAGQLRIRDPRLHDAVNGINLAVPPSDQSQVIGGPELQSLYPALNPTVELLATAADVCMVSLLEYFTDLPGAAPALASWPEIQDRIVNLFGLPVTPTSAAAATAYGAGVALNSTVALMKADEKYALLGYTVNTAFQTFAIVGPDTGNLRVGGPGIVRTWDTATWFIDQANALGVPCIPIIQANNQGATFVYIADSTASTAHLITLVLGELSS